MASPSAPPNSDGGPSTFIPRLAHWAATQPDTLAITFLNTPNDEKNPSPITYTYAELLSAASSISSTILATAKPPISPGDRVLLVYPPSVDFIIAFIACLMYGAVAVPVFPPDPRKMKRDIQMFASIVDSCGAQHCLTSTSYDYMKKAAALKDMFVSSTLKWPSHLTWLVTDKNVKRDRTYLTDTYGPPSSPTYQKYIASISSSSSSSSSSPSSLLDSIAFLQYTSGSTSVPKGVQITQRALSHNMSLITHNLRADMATVVVSWLPQYHDMGLIGSYLSLLYCGGRGVYYSPLSFIQNPSNWMRLVSAHRGTHLQAPNFAFQLAARKQPPSSKLDLTCVRHVINAAEPITVETLQLFLATFAPFGFDPKVLHPTYGLAEHTVFVCCGGRRVLSLDADELEGSKSAVVLGERRICELGGFAEGGSAADGGSSSSSSSSGAAGTKTSAARVRRVVGCGMLPPDVEPHKYGDVELVVADPETLLPLDENKIGEIWVRSDSKAAGYYKREEDNTRDFRARKELKEQGEAQKKEVAVAGEHYSSGFLRTGDLGFVNNNELFVTGRLKDLIIIRGRNFYPQDIEFTVESVDVQTFRGGCIAAFSLTAAELARASNTSLPRPPGSVSGASAAATVSPPMPLTASSPSGVGGGGGGGEFVVVLAEVRTPPKDDAAAAALCRSARTAIKKEHGLAVRFVAIVQPRTIPKTTSGKIARAWCKRAFLEGSLKLCGEAIDFDAEGGGDDDADNAEEDSANAKKLAGGGGASTAAAAIKLGGFERRDLSESELTTLLVATIARLSKMEVEEIDVKAPVSTMLDSVNVAQLKGELAGEYALEVSDQFMFGEDLCIVDLAEAVKRGGEGPANASAGNESGEVEDPQTFDGAGAAVAGAVQERRDLPLDATMKKKKKKKGGGAPDPTLAPPGLCCVIA